MGSKEIGLFSCQKDSYLKELEVQVISCENSTFKPPNGKAVKGFDVVFSDTVLFPEGGGQNDDHGTVNELQVKRVIRKQGQALHFTEKPLEIGQTVLQKVDWNRRFDHMQQHSGQHLLSAMFEQRLLYETLSWWMAVNTESKVGVSYIELDQEQVTPDELNQIEEACNEAIRQHIPVVTKIYDSDSEELKNAKTRGLPADHQGPVRVINIGNFDSNMCCGTHVSNLAELQMVKLLSCEKSKRKGNCFVYFLVGNRVKNYLANGYLREKSLTSILNGGPEDHQTLVEKATKNAKKYQKTTQNLLKEIALIKVNEIRASTNKKYFSIHRPETDMEFVNVLLFELSGHEVTLVITLGDDKEGPCQLVLQSHSENILKDIGKRIMETLEAKGGGKGKRLNGKFLSLKNRSKVDEILDEYFKE